MRVSNLLALFAAAGSVVSGYDTTSVVILEMEVYLSDIKAHMMDYIKMEIENPNQSFPPQIMSAYFAMIATDNDSYTTWFSGVPPASLEKAITGVAWYSSRLAPSIAAVLSAHGINTNEVTTSTIDSTTFSFVPTSTEAAVTTSSTKAAVTTTSTEAASGTTSTEAASSDNTDAEDMSISTMLNTVSVTGDRTIEETVTLCSSSSSPVETTSTEAASGTTSLKTASGTTSTEAASDIKSGSDITTTKASTKVTEGGESNVTTTIKNMSSTVVTITSCSDNVCTEVPHTINKTDNIVTLTGSSVRETVVKTFSTSTTKSGKSTASPVVYTTTHVNDLSTILVTITSCEGGCTKEVENGKNNASTITTLTTGTSVGDKTSSTPAGSTSGSHSDSKSSSSSKPASPSASAVVPKFDENTAPSVRASLASLLFGVIALVL